MIFTVLIAGAVAGGAQATLWQVSGDGQLDKASNWKNGVVPTTATMEFNASDTKPLFLDADMYAKGFTFASNAGTISNEFALGAGRTLWITNTANNAMHLKGNNTFLNLSSGTVKVGDGTTASCRVGDGAADGFTMLVTGADTTFDIGIGSFYLGWGSGNGLLSVRGGASFTGYLQIGIPNGTSSGNTLLVSDPGSTFSSPSNPLYVGNVGNGNAAVVSNQASLAAQYFRMPSGSYGNAKGTGNVIRVTSGASATFTGAESYLGYYTASNRVEVLDGGQLAVSTLHIGYGAYSGQPNAGNELIVDGTGSVMRVSSLLEFSSSKNIGRQFGRVSNGGEVWLTNDADDDAKTLRVGYQSPAELAVTDGGRLVTSNKCTWVGYDDLTNGGSKLLVARGGAMEMRRSSCDLNLRGVAGNPVQLVVDGGTLDAPGGRISFNHDSGCVITNGGRVAAKSVFFSAKNSQAEDSMTVAKDGVLDISYRLHLGGETGMARQKMFVRGGSVYCLSSGGDHAIGVGVSSPATLEVADGGLVVTSNNYFRVGSNSGAGGSLCRIGSGGRLETRTNGGADVRVTVTGGNATSSSLTVDGGTVEAATHCLYISEYGDITVKNGGYARFMKFYSDEVGTGKHSTIHIDDGQLRFDQWANIGYCAASTKGTVSVTGRNGRLYGQNGVLFKGDTTLEVTVPAEGFAQAPVFAGAIQFAKVDGVDAPTVKIDTSAFSGSARLVIMSMTDQSKTIEGLDDVTFELSDNAILDLSNPRQVAVYVNVDKVYTGEGSENWNDANNWTNIVEGGVKAVPQAGEGVVIAPLVAKTIVLDASTPGFKALEIGGNAAVTLVMTNWTTAIRATNVTIRSGSTVTCAGPFRDTEMSNRVWIVCRDLKIESTGAIDVNGKGFAKGDKGSSGNAWAGYGPGGGFRCGATHGGYGSQFAVLYADGHVLRLPNDDAAEPVLPGSGGGVSSWSSGGSGGGGAVRIDASGTVTVNGSILASATGQTCNTYAGGSAGGSILIHAAAFKGSNGVLKAQGGDSNRVPAYRTNDTAFPGGGGRIAVHYASAETSGMTVSAREGLFSSGSYPMGSNDYNRIEADIGTLYFSDDSVWKDGFGKRLDGVIANPQATAYDFEDVVFTNGHVRFGAAGLTFRMKSLAISGNNARLELGGDTVEQVASYRECRSATPSALIVAGDLSVAGNGRLDVRAAANGDAEGVGATVAVGGDLTVGAQGYVYAWSDVLTGARPRFVVSNDVTIAAGGVVSAEHRGFAGGHDASTDPVRRTAGHGFGPGYFYDLGGTYKQFCGGGGHGGKGSVCTYGLGAEMAATNGVTYDSAKYPTLPGSGGAHYNTAMWAGSAGGGVVEIRAGGTMTVDGTVNADGEVAHSVRGGSGAGGSITLAAPAFGGTGTLTAKGGPVTPSETKNDQLFRSGAGGGGRIGVVVGDYFGDTSRLGLRRTACPAAFTGTATALGGTHTYDTYAERDPNVGSLQGGEGTVRYSALLTREGAILIVR